MKGFKNLICVATFAWFAHALAFNIFAHNAAEDMAAAAKNFLNALQEEQRQKATFELKSEERYNWHFIPRQRKGLSFKEMTPAQRELAHALLNSAMSNRGYMKATTIMSLEQVLHELENGAAHRDPELYYFSVFGKPDAAGTWAWRVEGHHLSLNFTVADGKLFAVTPSFFGANPAEVRVGPRKGLRVLGAEEDLARKLVQSLTPEQQQIAIVEPTAPRDVITGADRKARELEPKGLPASQMTEKQKELLKQVLIEYVTRYRPELTESHVQKLKSAGPEKLFFAWAGPLEPGKGHYYRIQGPSFLLEYDNTQNDANHVHAVWRDLKNDFGEDILRDHYERVPHEK